MGRHPQKNRPYNVQNMVDNLHGKVKKASCQRVLDSMVADKKVCCKEFGKAKIYYADQSQFPATSKEELEEMDREVAALTAQLREATESVKSLAAQNALLTNELTDAELQTTVDVLVKEVCCCLSFLSRGAATPV